MTTPRWDDLDGWARDEVGPVLRRGLHPRDVVACFEGGAPTLYVRGRQAETGTPADRELSLRELLAFPAVARPEAVAMVVPVLLRDPALDGDVRSDLEAERALAVTGAIRAGGGASTRASMLPFRIGEHGRVAWDDPLPLPDGGPFDEMLTAVVTGRYGLTAEGLGVPGLAYALSRFGHVVGVHRDWRGRYGLDRVPDPAELRAEDRARARRAQAARRRAETRGPGGAR